MPSASSGTHSALRASRKAHSLTPPLPTTIATGGSTCTSAYICITWAWTNITIPFPITTRAMVRQTACSTMRGTRPLSRLLKPPGMNRDNDRYTFACAWGDSNGNGLPDLFVSNDFGTSQLYRNNGDGTFTVASAEAHVEGVGAGMGCSWCDYDNDGHQDIYVPSMWEAAGQRVSGQKQFHASAPESIRELYRRHARGNALYHNRGDGAFENVGHDSGVEMGRWSWSADFFDFDHDGYSDLYVSNGYISGAGQVRPGELLLETDCCQLP